MYLLECWFPSFFKQDVPNTTAFLTFRQLLAERGLGKLLFDAINCCLERNNPKLDAGHT